MLKTENWVWVLMGTRVSVCAGIGEAAYQVYLYLKHGEWTALSVIDGLLYLLRENPPIWLLYPHDWVGVHKLLDKTPLALGLFILGIFWLAVIGFLVFKLEEYQERKQREAEERYKRQDESQ